MKIGSVKLYYSGVRDFGLSLVLISFTSKDKRIKLRKEGKIENEKRPIFSFLLVISGKEGDNWVMEQLAGLLTKIAKIWNVYIQQTPNPPVAHAPVRSIAEAMISHGGNNAVGCLHLTHKPPHLITPPWQSSPYHFIVSPYPANLFVC